MKMPAFLDAFESWELVLAAINLEYLVITVPTRIPVIDVLLFVPVAMFPHMPSALIQPSALFFQDCVYYLPFKKILI